MPLQPLTEREIQLASGVDPDVPNSVPSGASPTGPEPTQFDQRNFDERFSAPSSDTEFHQAGSPQAGLTPDGELGQEDWITDDLIGEASTYGLGPADIAPFGSRDAVENHLRMMNLSSAKQFGFGQTPEATATPYPSYQQTQPTPQYQQQTPPTPPPVQQTPPTPAEIRQGFKEDGSVDFDFWSGQYDDESGIPALLQTIESQRQSAAEMAQKFDSLVGFMQQAAEAQQQHELQTMLDLYDPDFYGKTQDDQGHWLNIDKEYIDRRQKVADGLQYVTEVMRRQGIDPSSAPPMAIIKRAEQLMLGEERRQYDLRGRQNSLQNHSRQRRPQGASAGRQHIQQYGSAGQPEPMSAEQIANSPAVVDLWNRIQQENGATA